MIAARTGKNGRHRLVGAARQSVFGRLAGYEDVNDADRLSRDPAMRWVVGDRAITGSAASASQMGRFETKWLTRPENLTALADLPGQLSFFKVDFSEVNCQSRPQHPCDARISWRHAGAAARLASDLSFRPPCLRSFSPSARSAPCGSTWR